MVSNLRPEMEKKAASQAEKKADRNNKKQIRIMRNRIWLSIIKRKIGQHCKY